MRGVLRAVFRRPPKIDHTPLSLEYDLSSFKARFKRGGPGVEAYIRQEPGRNGNPGSCKPSVVSCGK